MAWICRPVSPTDGQLAVRLGSELTPRPHWADGIMPPPSFCQEPQLGLCHFASLAANTRAPWVARVALDKTNP